MSRPLLALPTWEYLPYNFKKDVVQLLDFQSRLSLRSCSKLDCSIVDHSPLSIRTLHIEQEDDEGFHMRLNFSENEPTFVFDIDEKDSNFSTAISALSSLMSNPKTTCNVFDIYCEPEFSSSLNDSLMRFLDSLKKNSTLNTKVFSWNSEVPAKDTILDFWEQLNPAQLHWVRLNFVDVELEEKKFEIIRKMVESEQWRELDKVRVYGCDVDDFFDDFLQVDNLKIRVNEFKETMLLKMIESVNTRDPPEGSQLIVSANTPIQFETLTSELEAFNGTHKILRDYQTTRRFISQTNDTRCLVIVKWEKTIEATVCRRANLDEDFEKYHGYSVTVDII